MVLSAINCNRKTAIRSRNFSHRKQWGIIVIQGVILPGAAAIAINIVVARFKVHLSKGFFITGDKAGFEYVFALLMIL